MTTRFFASPQIHLHWVRETPSRALELPVSETLDSLDALPSCVQNAVRAAGLPAVELHLPPYQPALCPDREAWLAGLTFRFDAVGRLVASPAGEPDTGAWMAFHQAIVLIARAITGDTTPLTLVADAGPAPVLRRPLARRHVCAPRGGLDTAPPECSRDYHRAYKAVSLAAQGALRQTLVSGHLRTLDAFEDRRHVHALLNWSAASPINGRHVDTLGLDVHNPRDFARANAGLTARLAAQLAEIWEILDRHNARPLIRDSYRPRDAVRIAKRVQRESRFFRLLFHNEGRILTAFVRFCARISDWQARSKGNPAVVYREVRQSWEALECLFRAFYQRQPHPVIGSLLLLEAVRTLEAVDYTHSE